MRIRKRASVGRNVVAGATSAVKTWLEPSSAAENGGDKHKVIARHSNSVLEASTYIPEVEDVSQDVHKILVGRTEVKDIVEEEEEEEEAGISSGKEGKMQGGRRGAGVLGSSLLLVFGQAGERGLTAREAVTRLIEKGLPGLQKGSSERSSVQVAKVLRSDPAFLQLESGKYFLYPRSFKSDATNSPIAPESEPSQQQHDAGSIPRTVEEAKVPISMGRSKRRRAPAPQTECDSSDIKSTSISGRKATEFSENIGLKKRRRRPPSSQHELAIGPTQCKRYDGRGWQCTQETEEGFSFCEHHQALINKRTLRLKLAKLKRTEKVERNVGNVPVKAAGNHSGDETHESARKPDGFLNMVQYQRGRIVKARSLRSIK